MVEIIFTILCLLLTILFVAVLAKKYNSNPRRRSKEDTMFKTAEREMGFLESDDASNIFEKSNDETWSESGVRRKIKKLNNKKDKRNKSDDQENESDEKEKKKDDREKKTDTRNKSHENELDLLSQNALGNGDNIEEEYQKFKSFVNVPTLYFKMNIQGTPKALFGYIRESLNLWKKREFNVAVIGNAGTGKSSLINALRNLKPQDEGAAKVGVVETTTKRQKYTFPNNDNVALWDLPGTGTQQFSKETYLDTMEFSTFDVVIIVTATRFLENDVWLAKESLDKKKDVLFVRTKIDIDMMNSKRDYPNQSETEIMNSIKENITDNIKKGKLPDMDSRIYLVSSPDRKYDFQTLNSTLKGLLDKRGKAIRFWLEKCIKMVIQGRRIRLESDNKFWRLTGILSAVFTGSKARLPKLVKEDYDYCLRQFSLDDQSLEIFSEELSLSKEDIKKRLKTYKLLSVDEDVLIEDTGKGDKKRNPFTGKFTFRIPLLRMFIHSLSGYRNAQECLETICNQMAEDEHRLLCLRLIKLEKELNPLETSII